MNEKWFAYAVSLSIILIFVNAFITIGATQLDANGNTNLFLMNSTNNKFDYSNIRVDSNFYTTGITGDSSQSPTNEQGYQPVKRNDGQSKSFDAFDTLVNMALGVEIVMIQLATIFSPVAPLFWAIAGFAFFVKSIAAIWLASMVVRQLFFGRVF